jgi:hypothetical protein
MALGGDRELAAMLGIILGIFTIGLGVKAFTPTGLPLSKTKNLTGASARVIGVVCILLGAFFIADGVFGTMRILSLLSGSSR